MNLDRQCFGESIRSSRCKWRRNAEFQSIVFFPFLLWKTTSNLMSFEISGLDCHWFIVRNPEKQIPKLSFSLSMKSLIARSFFTLLSTAPILFVFQNCIFQRSQNNKQTSFWILEGQFLSTKETYAKYVCMKGDQ